MSEFISAFLIPVGCGLALAFGLVTLVNHAEKFALRYYVMEMPLGTIIEKGTKHDFRTMGECLTYLHQQDFTAFEQDGIKVVYYCEAK